MTDAVARLAPTPTSPTFATGSRIRRIEPLESAIALIGLIVIMSTFRSILLSAGETTADTLETGSRQYQLITLFFTLSGIFFMAFCGVPRWFKRLLVASLPLLAMTALAGISVLWSIEPGISLRRFVALVLSTSFCYYLALRFTFDEFVAIFMRAAIIFMIVGYVATLIPGEGITPHTHLNGTWRGMTGQKNEFGRVCAIIVGSLLTLRLAGYRMPSLILWAIVGGTFVLLVLSDSKTSLVAAMVGIMGALFVTFLATGRVGGAYVSSGLRITVCVAAVLGAVVAVFVLLPLILEVLGRDATLSGRENLWEFIMIRYDALAPWGAGYRAFWTQYNLIHFFEHFWWRDAETSRAPFNSHSGYYDLLSELGIPGLLAGAFLLAAALLTCFLLAARGQRPQGMLFAFSIAFLMVYSVTERAILQYFDVAWITFSVAYLFAVRALVLGRSEVPNGVT